MYRNMSRNMSRNRSTKSRILTGIAVFAASVVIGRLSAVARPATAD